MTWKTLQLSDYDDVVRMLHELMSKCNDVQEVAFTEFVDSLEYDIGLIIDKLEESTGSSRHP